MLDAIMRAIAYPDSDSTGEYLAAVEYLVIQHAGGLAAFVHLDTARAQIEDAAGKYRVILASVAELHSVGSDVRYLAVG